MDVKKPQLSGVGRIRLVLGVFSSTCFCAGSARLEAVDVDVNNYFNLDST